MNAMFAALLLTVVISVGAWWGLTENDYRFSNGTAREAVRLD